jgi:hypothetical protein
VPVRDGKQRRIGFQPVFCTDFLRHSLVADFTGPCAVISRYRPEAYATLLCLAEDEFENEGDLVAATPRWEACRLALETHFR